MIVHAIKCNKCLDTIYSRARHDFRSCTCGAVSIDGGFDYTKVSGPAPLVTVEVEIGEINKAQLYQDWNRRIDKYGRIKHGENS